MNKNEKTYLINQSTFDNSSSSKDLSLDHKFEFYKLITELTKPDNTPEFTLWASSTLKKMAQRFPLRPVPKEILELQIHFLKLEPLNNRFDVLKNSLRESFVGGTYLEFGVWTGDSLLFMSSQFPDKDFIGFDEFKNINNKPNSSNISLVSGRFENTLKSWKLSTNQNISFMHIDADLYEPCKLVLFELNDLIVTGTVIQFDELLDFNTKLDEQWLEGEWKALHEWATHFNRHFIPLFRDDTCRASIKVL